MWSTVEAEDEHRLFAMTKGALSREIEALGELRPLVLDGASEQTEGVQGTVASDNMQEEVNGKQPGDTPKKSLSSIAAFLANGPNKHDSPLAGFSPHAITPSKRTRADVENTNVLISSSTNLSNSLSILSRYILIAAFLASSNPSKKDMLMLATAEDDLALSKRRKKGGAMRKTPNRKNAGGGSNANGGGDDMGGPVRKKDTMVPMRMLGPKPFPIERLIAITETILPVEMRNLAKSPDILQEVRSC